MRIIKLLVLAFLLLFIVAVVAYGVIVYKELAQLPPQEGEVPVRVLDKKDKVVLFALGDNGSGLQPQKDVAQAMEERCQVTKPDALLLLGDLAYPDGFESIDDPRWETFLFSMYDSECLGKLPIFPVLGNHDYDSDTRSWLEIGKRYERWWFPYRQYTVRFPELLTIYAIDSNYPNGLDEAIPDLFLQPLTPWSISIGHHPIRSESAGGGRHKGGGLAGWFMKRALCDKVDTYISGHSHHMEHIKIDGCRLDQYVSGAGGGALQKIKDNPNHEFGMEEYGFLEIEVTSTNLSYRFITKDSDVVYKSLKSKMN